MISTVTNLTAPIKFVVKQAKHYSNYLTLNFNLLFDFL